MKEKITMSKKLAKPIQRRRINDDESKLTCIQALEHAKSLCTKDTKIVKSVKLSQTIYKTSSNISVILEPEYKNKLITPLVIVEGEGKVYHSKNDNFNKDEPYFIKIRPIAMNPILYQIMQCIYTDLNYLDPDNSIEEKTFKDYNLYINGSKIMSANIEYLKNGKPIGKRTSVAEEINELVKKDPQMIKAVLVVSRFFNDGVMCKIGFNLKTLIMEKVCKTTIIDTDGKVISIVTSGETDTEDDSDSETDIDKECAKLQNMKLPNKKHTDKGSDYDDDDGEEDKSLFSLP
ncbi:DNA-binding phosphoprotein [Cheloniid poxvirus 1]|nr:DNA-binding phosphoprotein [Cheloniid poxvirus 1]